MGEFHIPQTLNFHRECVGPTHLTHLVWVRHCASSIFLQPLTRHTINHNIITQKIVCLVSILGLLTLLSSGFNPIPLLTLSPLRQRSIIPISAVVFRKVQFLVPSCSSS